MSPVTYKDSGVDLEKYEKAMQRLPRLMHRTFSPRVMKNDGGFAGLFQLDFNCALFSRKYEEPILVSGTDGVGTKLKVAIEEWIFAVFGYRKKKQRRLMAESDSEDEDVADAS